MSGAWGNGRASDLQSLVVATAVAIIQTHISCFTGRTHGCLPRSRGPRGAGPNSHHPEILLLSVGSGNVSSVLCPMRSLSLNSLEATCSLPSLIAHSSQ